MIREANAAIQKAPDTMTGLALAGSGATGFTIQTIADWASYAITFGNLFLVIGGMYIMYIKLRQFKRRDRRAEDKK